LSYSIFEKNYNWRVLHLGTAARQQTKQLCMYQRKVCIKKILQNHEYFNDRKMIIDGSLRAKTNNNDA
jgi:hypothetical protein